VSFFGSFSIHPLPFSASGCRFYCRFRLPFLVAVLQRKSSPGKILPVELWLFGYCCSQFTVHSDSGIFEKSIKESPRIMGQVSGTA
jgi:hypothetical protein